MTSELETLSDYPALKKLAEALWQQDSKQCGAAIMVGAGFSRCSASHVGGAKKLRVGFFECHAAMVLRPNQQRCQHCC